MKCSVENCEGKVHCKGLCKLHYQRKWRVGSTEVSRPCLHGTLEERFWRYVRKSEGDGCWLWLGRKDKDGYGGIRDGGTHRRAHRVSYEIHFAALPGSQVLRHRCNNPPCVNPNHLIPGTHLENMADRKAAGHYLRGESHFNSKITDQQAEEIRGAVGTYREIAKRFGISPSLVGSIRNRRHRKQQEAA